MPSTERSISRLESSRIDTHRLCSPGATFSFRTLKAFLVWLVTRTLLPCARKCPIRFAMVWVLPVPGGPCTRTALYCSIRCAISSCSLLASLESNTSTLSPPTAASCSSMDSSPSSSGKSIFPPLTMSEIGAGTNPVCWMFSIIFSIAFGVPSNLLRTI